jgi:hypothetical protein
MRIGATIDVDGLARKCETEEVTNVIAIII